MVPRSPSASLNRRLWEMAQRYDVPLGPVLSWHADLGERQQRIALTSLVPTPARWIRYVNELRAVAEAVRSYGDE